MKEKLGQCAGNHGVQQAVTGVPSDQPGGLPSPAHPGAPAAGHGLGEGGRYRHFCHLQRSSSYSNYLVRSV